MTLAWRHGFSHIQVAVSLSPPLRRVPLTSSSRYSFFIQDLHGAGSISEMRNSVLILVALAAVVAPAAAASRTSSPQLVATVVNAVAHKPYPRAGAIITVSFTVGEPNKPVGSGVSSGSVFNVQLIRKMGRPMFMTAAIGSDGRYRATTRWSGGLIGRIRIGGFLNATPSTAQGGFWLPVTVLKKNF
jgi:hypothetical protein